MSERSELRETAYSIPCPTCRAVVEQDCSFEHEEDFDPENWPMHLSRYEKAKQLLSSKERQ